MNVEAADMALHDRIVSAELSPEEQRALIDTVPPERKIELVQAMLTYLTTYQELAGFDEERTLGELAFTHKFDGDPTLDELAVRVAGITELEIEKWLKEILP